MCKSALSWLLTGVLATVSFAGPSLHSILGLHHCGVFGQNVGTCAVSQSSEKVAPQVVSSAHGDCDDANCPICNYLIQAKIAVDHVDLAVSAIVVRNENFVPKIEVPSATLRPTEARGPPAAI